jgi:hypothetical protein
MLYTDLMAGYAPRQKIVSTISIGKRFTTKSGGAVSANLLYGFGQFILQSQEIDWFVAIAAPDEHRSEGGKRLRALPAVKGFRVSFPLLSFPHFLRDRHRGSMVSHYISTSLVDCLPLFLQIKLSKSVYLTRGYFTGGMWTPHKVRENRRQASVRGRRTTVHGRIV